MATAWVRLPLPKLATPASRPIRSSRSCVVAVTGLTPAAVLVLVPTLRDRRPGSGVRRAYSQSSPLRVRYLPIEHCYGARRAPVLRRAAMLSDAAAGQT